jgi:hypothetical protein
MSILCKSPDGWIISHEKFFQNIKVPADSGVELDGASSTSDTSKQYKHVKLDTQLFEIVNPFIVPKKSVPVKSDVPPPQSEVSGRVEKVFKSLLELGQEQNIFPTTSASWIKTKEENNRVARLRANTFYDQIKDFDFIKNEVRFFGINSESYGTVSKVRNHLFLFPENTRFYCSDVDEIEIKLKDENPFDLIILDPPWRNKYVRRRKRKQAEAGCVLI